MKRIALVFALLFWSFQGFVIAQATQKYAPTKYAIKGTLMNAASDEPVEFATVSIFNELDSSIVTGGLTDVEGVFNVPADIGKYYLRFQFMGFEDLIISNVTISTSNPIFNTGIIKIKENETLLEEVVVQAERTQMQMTLDKKVFNIGKDLSNLGGSATDILDNLPSVQVDVEGNVSLRGSQNVRILIDGKPSGLVGLSSNDALRQLNSNLVESVEVITNPSARYDAEGLAGIINIVLKKDKKKGINGSFQANTGVPHNHGGSINLNFRRDWINFFTNFGVNYRRYNGSGASNQIFFDSSDRSAPLLQTLRNRRHNRGGISYSTRFGSDIYLNDKNTLTLAFLYRFADENNRTRITYDDFYPTTEADSISFRNDDETEGDENIEYSLNFTRNFSRKDQKLTFDLQYQNNNEQEGSNLIETIGTDRMDQLPILIQRSNNDEIEERYMIQADYLHPFSKNGKLEFGTRYTDRLVGNDYLVTEQNESGIYEVDSAFSNEFEYEEDVLAVYGIISNKVNKLSWQMGLRFEQTRLVTFQKTDNNRNVQNYGNFFPSIFLTYQISKEQSIQMSYSRRISRPRGRSLNPFTSISDSRNFWLGNPELQPEFTDSYELGYLYNSEAGSIYAGVYNRHTEGGVQRLRNTTEEGITFTRPYNVSTENAYGLEINLSKDFTNWYRVNGNVNFYRSIVPSGSVAFGESILRFDGAEATTLTSRISNNLKFKSLFDAQINMIYRAPRNTVQGRSLSITSVDLGMSRDILKDKGTLALNVSDVFNSRRYRSEITNERSIQSSEFQWRSTTATLSFTYRLNQKKQQSGKGSGEYQGDGGGDF